MFPLYRTCVKIAAADALIVLAASATLANEMIQKSGRSDLTSLFW